jgi:hypothetical protein
MNEDHAEAVVLYAQVFGDRPQTEKAQMVAVDPQGMDLSIEVQETMEMLRIPFDHVLQDSEDAIKSIQELILIGSSQTEEDKEFVKDAEYDMKSIFIKFLPETLIPRSKQMYLFKLNFLNQK